MPLWDADAIVKGSMTGVPITVFNAEALSDNEESEAIALPNHNNGKGVNVTFTILFGSAPTTVDYILQDAINNIDAEYYDIASSNITATAGGKLTVIGVNGRFVRIKAVDADTQTVTAQIMVS